jgi:putative toxin-antitoxin system antitoxin component (TIGR02293 family)
MSALDTLLAGPPADQIAAIRAGIPACDVIDLAEQVGLTVADLATVLGLGARRLKYRAQAGQVLDAIASERLLRLARVAHHAADAFGDAARAGTWLISPHRLLGKASPLSLLDTAHGGHEVERQLLAIEHGLPV